jgi:RHS repeat-associated protein
LDHKLMACTIVNEYAYDEFGNIVGNSETVSNPFKYVGQYGVMDDGNGLYNMRARYYDPQNGRFISEDPIGLAGGINQFAYVGNAPLNWIDPVGLLGFTTGIEGSGSAFGFGGLIGLYGNFSHDSSKPWYAGWSSSVTVNLSYGAAGAVYGAGADVYFGGNNTCNVSQLNGTTYNGGRSGIGVISISGFTDGKIKGGGVGIGFGQSFGYTGATAGQTKTWTLGGGNW